MKYLFIERSTPFLEDSLKEDVPPPSERSMLEK